MRVDESLVLLWTSSLKVEVDPLEIEPVMVLPNPVGALILTQRHDGGHASMDSVCWKCKQAWICFSATDSDLLNLVSIEKTQTHYW